MGDKITELAKGKWHGILRELGFDARILNKREHKCPSGMGTTFRFSDKFGKGNFFCTCNPDGKGDGFGLIKCCKNVEFFEAAKMVEGVIGKVKEVKKEEQVDVDKIKSIMNPIIKSAHSTERNLVIKYLNSRGILDVPDTIKQAVTSYALANVGVFSLQDAMVVAFSVGGKLGTLHITYLDKHGRKVHHDRAKVMVTPLRPLAGGSVALQDPVDGVLGVGEGIESSLSGGQLFGVPVHACLNANLLQKFEPPPGVRKLIIFGDNDRSFTGQSAAFNLARRCTLDPRRKIECEVKIPGIHFDPDDAGKDWNDVL